MKIEAIVIDYNTYLKKFSFVSVKLINRENTLVWCLTYKCVVEGHYTYHETLNEAIKASNKHDLPIIKTSTKFSNTWSRYFEYDHQEYFRSLEDFSQREVCEDGGG